MNLALNSAQAKGLANLFFDLAKGLLLGGATFTVIGTAVTRISVGVFSLVIALICVRAALQLLEGINRE